MKSCVFILSSCMLALLINSARSCSTELDMDFRGLSRPNDISYQKASSFQDCCAKCSADSKCQAWTFVFATNVCWFKSEVGWKLPSAGRISGLRSARTCSQEVGFVYYYNDISQPLSIATPGECCTRCGQTAGCVAYSFLAGYNYCYLKNALPTAHTRVARANSFSGILV